MQDTFGAYVCGISADFKMPKVILRLIVPIDFDNPMTLGRMQAILKEAAMMSGRDLTGIEVRDLVTVQNGAVAWECIDQKFCYSKTGTYQIFQNGVELRQR